MNVIQLATPSHFSRKGQIERVGVHRNRLFVALRSAKELELWSVHFLVPNSWTRLFTRSFHELFYSHCAVSAAQNAVFAMVAAFFETETKDGGISILRFDLDTGELVEFGLDAEEASKFEEVTLERVGMGCGRSKGNLFLYDRTMVTGQIPFWRIALHWETKTFSISAHPILDEQHLCAHCTRFPVVLDGDSRSILRITNNCEVLVYDGDTEQWELLRADEQTGLDLASIPVRGISETFGHNWHRFSAIESKLSVFVDGPICVFKVLQDGRHHFYRFSRSMERNTYNLARCSRAKLRKELETLCYVHCAESRMVFLNKQRVGVVSTQPPPLREICFWAMQRRFAELCPRKLVWSGGKSPKEFQAMLNINAGMQIVD